MKTQADPMGFHRSTYADAAMLSDWATLPVEEWPDEWFLYNEKVYPRAETLLLPRPAVDGDTALPARVSGRTALPSVELPRLSTVLWNATHATAGNDVSHAEWHRPYPSAGGRLGCEVYLLARDVDGLASGVYSYQVRHHSLSRIRSSLTGSVVRMLFGADWVADTCAVLAITASLDRLDVKYGPRAYRYALLEAGALAQTLCLVAANEQVGTCVLGGFADVALAQLLLCTPTTEFPAVTVALASYEVE